MARFIGSVQGARGEATRLGHPSSGIQVKANGWNLGCTVTVSRNGEDEDEVSIVATDGSGNRGIRFPIATFTRRELDEMIAAASAKAGAR